MIPRAIRQGAGACLAATPAEEACAALHFYRPKPTATNSLACSVTAPRSAHIFWVQAWTQAENHTYQPTKTPGHEMLLRESRLRGATLRSDALKVLYRTWECTLMYTKFERTVIELPLVQAGPPGFVVRRGGVRALRGALTGAGPGRHQPSSLATGRIRRGHHHGLGAPHALLRARGGTRLHPVQLLLHTLENLRLFLRGGSWAGGIRRRLADPVRIHCECRTPLPSFEHPQTGSQRRREGQIKAKRGETNSSARTLHETQRLVANHMSPAERALSKRPHRTSCA